MLKLGSGSASAHYSNYDIALAVRIQAIDGARTFTLQDSQPCRLLPLSTLRRAPRGTQRKTRGRVVRYSFLVGLFHSLLHAGFARRTELAILALIENPGNESSVATTRVADFAST